jgi:hypothetical protein
MDNNTTARRSRADTKPSSSQDRQDGSRSRSKSQSKRNNTHAAAEPKKHRKAAEVPAPAKSATASGASSVNSGSNAMGASATTTSSSGKSTKPKKESEKRPGLFSSLSGSTLALSKKINPKTSARTSDEDQSGTPDRRPDKIVKDQIYEAIFTRRRKLRREQLAHEYWQNKKDALDKEAKELRDLDREIAALQAERAERQKHLDNVQIEAEGMKAWMKRLEKEGRELEGMAEGLCQQGLFSRDKIVELQKKAQNDADKKRRTDEERKIDSAKEKEFLEWFYQKKREELAKAEAEKLEKEAKSEGSSTESVKDSKRLQEKGKERATRRDNDSQVN